MKAVYLLAIIVLASVLALKAYGDGLSSEILQPSLVGKTNVTLSIGSTPFLIDNTHTGTQLKLVLLDADTKQPIPYATLEVTGLKGQIPLFGHIFKSDSGNFLLNFYPQSGNMTYNEQGGLLSSLFGQDTGTYDVKGPIFESAGLYRFKIEVMTMGAYDYQVSKSYSAGISIPEYDNLTINDPGYGTQQAQIIAYYDQIHNISYDPAKRFINFTMPFDWSEQNIGQITVIHQEIRIPRALGDLIVAKYDAYVNNIKIPDKLISIDDYSMTAYKIVHLILYKSDVQALLSEQTNPGREMNFALKPSSENEFPIVQLTRNAQYKVTLSWDPAQIIAGSTTQFNFKVIDPFTMNKTIGSIPYDFTVLEGTNGAIYHEVGKTSGSESGNNISVQFPSNYTGPITIAFENLNGNNFASTEFPATVGNAAATSSSSVGSQATVPEFPYASLVALTVVFGVIVSFTKISMFKSS